MPSFCLLYFWCSYGWLVSRVSGAWCGTHDDHNTPPFDFLITSSVFPSCISGVHHFWARFMRMWLFLIPIIEVVTFRLCGYFLRTISLTFWGCFFPALEKKWQEQPRTECDGRGSLMAYAPLGAMGISFSCMSYFDFKTQKFCFPHKMCYTWYACFCLGLVFFLWEGGLFFHSLSVHEVFLNCPCIESVHEYAP